MRQIPLPGVIDSFSGEYRFLSNFWPCVILYDNTIWPTVEHAYQAAKTTNPAFREIIRTAGSGGEAKKLGYDLRLPEGWDKYRVPLMMKLLAIKFPNGHAELSRLLVMTDPAILIEGNTWGDKFWGQTWINGRLVGENHLGRLLMARRNQLIGGTH